MTFWDLMETERCDECKGKVIKIDDETYYCPNCHTTLSLCGNYGACEGIAHNWPYNLEGGTLIETANLINGWCDLCGSGWELA